MSLSEQRCPQCGSELRFGWWLKWCSNHMKFCKWWAKREADDIPSEEELTDARAAREG